MSVTLSLSFVGRVVPRCAHLELDESNNARRKKHSVQPLSKAKQWHFDENCPFASCLSGLRERASKQFDLPFPCVDLLSFGGSMKRDVTT
jgi:hypothetical protein